MYTAQTYRSNWWGFIGKRILIAVVVFLVISFLILFTLASPYHSIIYVVPVYPLMDSPESLYVNQHMHYDDPYLSQFCRWLGNFFTGNWGDSFIKGVPVWDLIF
jgi:peptide/nickel transport system permease protein